MLAPQLFMHKTQRILRPNHLANHRPTADQRRHGGIFFEIILFFF